MAEASAQAGKRRTPPPLGDFSESRHMGWRILARRSEMRRFLTSLGFFLAACPLFRRRRSTYVPSELQSSGQCRSFHDRSGNPDCDTALLHRPPSAPGQAGRAPSRHQRALCRLLRCRGRFHRLLPGLRHALQVCLLGLCLWRRSPAFWASSGSCWPPCTSTT